MGMPSEQSSSGKVQSKGQIRRCLTMCAPTYQAARRSWRAKNQPEEEEEGEGENDGVMEIKAWRQTLPPPSHPIEGSYLQYESCNYGAYLEAVGAGVHTREMLVQARSQVTLLRATNWSWLIVTETFFKVENLWEPGKTRKEMTEDWDLRNLTSCLLEGEEGELVVWQNSNTNDMLGTSASNFQDKDQDEDEDEMSTYYQLDQKDKTVLVITHRIGKVVAERKCRKCKSRIF